MSSAITRCFYSWPSVLSLPRSAPSSHEHHWHPVAVLLQLPAPEVQPHCHHQTRALLWICARQNLSLAVNLTIPLFKQRLSPGEASRQFSHECCHREKLWCDTEEGRITHPVHLWRLLLICKLQILIRSKTHCSAPQACGDIVNSFEASKMTSFS